MRMIKIGGRGTGWIRCHVTGKGRDKEIICYLYFTHACNSTSDIIERGDMRGVSDVRGSGMSSAILVEVSVTSVSRIGTLYSQSILFFVILISLFYYGFIS